MSMNGSADSCISKILTHTYSFNEIRSHWKWSVAAVTVSSIGHLEFDDAVAVGPGAVISTRINAPAQLCRGSCVMFNL